MSPSEAEITRQETAVEALPWTFAPHSADLPPAVLAGFIDVFSPATDTPDHVLTWRAQETGPLRWVTSTIRQHGPWVRTDTVDGAAVNVEVVHLPTGVVVSAGRNDDGPVRYFEIKAPERRASDRWTQYTGVATDQTGSFSGEPCRWWEVYRGVEDGLSGYRRQACMTGDGIRVASRILDGDDNAWPYSSASMIELIRQPVSSDEVRPPPVPADWLAEMAAEAGSSSIGNFAVRLSGSDGAVLLLRQRGAWRGEQTRTRDGTMSLNAYDEPGRSISVHVAADGRPILLRVRHAPAFSETVVPTDAPVETVLGLECLWVDTTPHQMDAGRHECRTEDGIPLKIRLFRRGGSSELVAEDIDRTAGSVQDLMPPPALLDLATWGVSR